MLSLLESRVAENAYAIFRPNAVAVRDSRGECASTDAPARFTLPILTTRPIARIARTLPIGGPIPAHRSVVDPRGKNNIPSVEFSRRGLEDESA
jgi:hypothetical protein